MICGGPFGEHYTKPEADATTTARVEVGGVPTTSDNLWDTIPAITAAANERIIAKKVESGIAANMTGGSNLAALLHLGRVYQVAGADHPNSSVVAVGSRSYFDTLSANDCTDNVFQTKNDQTWIAGGLGQSVGCKLYLRISNDVGVVWADGCTRDGKITYDRVRMVPAVFGGHFSGVFG